MNRISNILNEKWLTFLLLVAIFPFSCKDNVQDIFSNGSLANAKLATKARVESALIEAYSELSAGGFSEYATPNNWVFGDILGGDSNSSIDAMEYSPLNTLQRYEIDANQGDLNSAWQSKYEGISGVNLVLRLAAEAKDIPDTDLKRIQGEARFLRGHFYFDLKKIWNSVPYIDESLKVGKEKVPNTPAFWDKIEADFKFAFDNLPETHSLAGRVNKWAAGAYLAKAYLYQKKWPEAKSMFDQVVAHGKTSNDKKYGLLTKFDQIYNGANDNHEEAVFSVQIAMNTDNVNNVMTGANGPGNCCGLDQPSFDAANSFRTKDGLPLLNGSYNSAAYELKNDYNVASSSAFTPDAGPVDPRLDHSIGRRGLPYLDWGAHPGKDWIRNQSYSGPYSLKKYMYYKTQENTLTDGSSWSRGIATMNYTVIRFGDVLLMAAEAEAELGNQEKARSYVNMIRARAADPGGWVKKPDGSNAANYQISLYDAPWTDKTSAIEAVRFERRLELSQEGHRFFDLVRWGIAADVLNKYLAHEAVLLSTKFGGARFTAGKNEFLPIPQVQIDLQGVDVLKQNPGY